MLRKDTVVGRNYRLMESLGSGGMGEVFRAYDQNLCREVAIKFLLDASSNEENRKRFLNEGRILATIKHPSIVTVYSADVDEKLNVAFLVMELVDGKKFDQFQAELRTDIPGLVRHFINILEGIHACHKLGIIHRDLKPANILIDKEGVARLVDFGIAKTSLHHTKTGMLIGTPRYMSPEQCSGDPVSPKSDIYAMGIILWETLVGRHPFQLDEEAADPFLAMVFRHVNAHPPLDELTAAVGDTGFVPLLERMLAKKAAGRPEIPEIVAVLKAEAERAISGKGPPATSPELAAPSTSPVKGKKSTARKRVSKIQGAAPSDTGEAFRRVSGPGFRDGKRAYRNRDFTLAFKLFKPLAEAGEAEAQYYLGRLYGEGLGTPKDPQKAFALYLAAAEKGIPDSQFQVALALFGGIGTGKDIPEAFRWFGKAAANDVRDAQLYYATMLYEGLGTPSDPEKALPWFLKAAQKGSALARYQIGLQYYLGKGVDKDFEKAKEWFTDAAHKEVPEAQYHLGLMYLEGCGFDQDLSVAFSWIKKAAIHKYAEAQARLGKRYLTGEGTDPDVDQAIFWYVRAAEQGHPLAQVELGEIYLKGLGGRKNDGEAFKWLSLAARQENAAAQFLLAGMYLQGMGMPKNLEEARNWLKKARENGDSRAQTALAELENPKWWKFW